MRLLNKQEVNTLKGVERKKEIDEGVKLAKKVDLLRETAAKEEANLSKFRTETLRILREDVERLTIQKQILSQEVEQLKIEKAMLRELINNIKNT